MLLVQIITTIGKHRDNKIKYAYLAIDIELMRHVNSIDVIPIIGSAIGQAPKAIHENTFKLGLHKNTYIKIQKAVILNSCRRVRKFLSIC